MTPPDSSHEHHEERPASGARGHAGHGLMMLACVALMGGAVTLMLWRGVSNGWWLLPMMLCMGAHFLVHRGHGGQRK